MLTNHPNRNWRRRWTVDAAAMTATHDSGLIVRFRETGDGYDGEIIAGMPDLSRSVDVATSQAQRLARLLREAGDVMVDKMRASNDP